MADLELLRVNAEKHITLYCNEKMWKEMGVAMPEFAKVQSCTLLDCMDRAIQKTKADPRYNEIKEIMGRDRPGNRT